MAKQKNRRDTEPTVAPGIDGDEELNQKATAKETEQGESTEVTTLSYDEVDPS
ncbi:MAG: hypothetical protein LOD88_13850 [Novibacillus thermophilus]|jgi:hypothetical protein|uniref:hypothetical protein n=1 Tax=Novibacillus thermophilus TaxID=1471761 RepID=UPI0014732592|nr:hypothetical protein [Novibacillus thermophilus]